MYLYKIKIDNFRNIAHAEYLLSRINLFVGPNQLGKTNTILAVYWAMTDFLLDGSSDYPSFKPHGNPRAEVSVELTFDELTLRKTYKEKWTKTRGSEEETMTGHETVYYIDGLKTSVTNAKKELAARFNVNVDTGKFDLLRGIMDPYYFAKGVDWKILRSFIIQICGDVSNEEIFNASPDLKPIKERLELDKYDTGRTVKYFRQQLKASNDQLGNLDAQIQGLQKIFKPSDSDIASARSALEQIDENIRKLKAGDDADAAAVQMLELNRALVEAQDALRASKLNDKEATQAANQAIQDQIAAKQNEITAANAKSDAARNELIKADNAKIAKDNEVSQMNLRIGDAERTLRNAREEYDKRVTEYEHLKSWTAPEGQRCPHCGGVLNQDYIDSEIKRHQDDMNACIDAGKQAAANKQQAETNLENLKLKFANLQKEVEPLEAASKQKREAYSSAQDAVLKLYGEIADLRGKVSAPVISEATRAAQTAVENAESAIATARANVVDSSLAKSNLIRAEEDKKAVHQNVLDQLAAFNGAQKEIASLAKERDGCQKAVLDYEQKLIMVQSFIAKKLDLFKDHIAKVFGERMRFQLIQENIKEGSWNEVCVPMIIDKATPYENGSGSEQIITGIYFAECVKKALSIPDLPYIFDECDKLDTAHIRAIETNGQVLSTLVDDIKYERIKLIATR